MAKALIAQRAFEVFCEGLAVGEGEAEAIRKSLVLLGEPESAERSTKQLIKWGERLGLLERGEDGLVLSPKVAPTPIGALPLISRDDLESEVKARLMIATRLGKTVFNGLDESVRTLLTEAALKVNNDPEESCTNAGKAVEDYLRVLCGSCGLAQEASKKNGASQLAGLLLQHKKIHPHHQKIVDLPSMARNAVSHNKDKRTMQPWNVTALASWTALLASLTAVRAIYEFVVNGRQTI